jgi:predicted ABC-type transport system involved in lysophospholipase L1 biosynthesis ATPase subunit
MAARHRTDDDGEVADVGYVELTEASLADTAPVAAPPAIVVLPITASTITARHLTYERNGRTILDDVSLQIRPGEVVGITGPSGSGKTSLLALLAQLEDPSVGEVRVDPPVQRRGVVLQSYGLASSLTAAENVEVALQSGVAGRLGSDEIRRRAGVAVEMVGLSDVADHLVEELSGGQQQRVAVARALAVEPSVLFADEVSTELDHDAKQRVVNLVFGLAGRGATVVLATHDPAIASRCTRELRLVDGRIEDAPPR